MTRPQCVSDDGPVALPAQCFELVIFDLDGVLTRTARVHARAWKTVFDAFLASHAEGATPFDAVADYLAHVDGKPRLDGVRDFLASRGLSVPEGSSDDAPGLPTCWGLGNAKNAAFIAHLDGEGVETYAPGVALIEKLGECGIGCAVVSASRNARRVLGAAGLLERVETVVDGNDAAREGLAGKPAPDTFLAACDRLQVPASRAAVLEDAEAGVAAAQAGGFGMVIGVDRAGHAAALRARGASCVVQSLDALIPSALPSPLGDFASLRARIGTRAPVILLDYDGTLTPIVARPEDAVLAPAMRRTLAALARHCTVAIVTGRGLEVIRELVGLEGVVYLADHGLQMLLTGGEAQHPDAVSRFEPLIRRVVEDLRGALSQVQGVLIESKRYSVAVHYRLAAEEDVPGVRRVVDTTLARTPELRLLEGKKVWELQPDLVWDKGTAVSWLLERLHVAPGQVVYVGDDVTDEHAFRVLRGGASTVVVQSTPRRTAAGYRVSNVEEVGALLARLLDVVETEGTP